MTEFGRFLGTNNGEYMIAEVLKRNHCSKEQARAVITAYCIIFEIEVDTATWDNLMAWIWNSYNSWFDTYDEMDMYMCELIV